MNKPCATCGYPLDEAEQKVLTEFKGEMYSKKIAEELFMSTIKEIAESKTTILIKPKEGFLLSTSKDLVTLAVILLCVYVSQGSAWWTLVTGLIFIFFVAGKISSVLTKNATTFETKYAAIEYLKREEI